MNMNMNSWPIHSEINNINLSETRLLTQTFEEMSPYLQKLRRQFHMYPEVSMEEAKTSLMIREELEKLNIPYTIVEPYGIVGYIKGERLGKTVGLRADMDALMITEQNDIPYKSQNQGVMHACGHDVHMAMLLGAAKELVSHKSEIKGIIKLIFQQAEENGKGAPLIVKSGEIDDCSAIFGLHQTTEMCVGKVSIKQKEITGNNVIFTVKVKGHGGHGSEPHNTVDPIASTISILNSLQQLISREIPSYENVVLSIGYIDTSSHSCNVIPNEVNFGGTIRFANYNLKERLEEVFRRIVSSVAQAHRTEVDILYLNVATSVYNDTELTRFAGKVIESVVGSENLILANQWLASEDFWEYQNKVPVTYFFMGSGSDKYNQPLHSPLFNIDEASMSRGAMLFYKLAIDYLNSN